MCRCDCIAPANQSAAAKLARRAIDFAAADV
jgi:hypothetical protein